MTGKDVLLRCASCRTLNRVPVNRLRELPRCGKCRALLDFPKDPVDVGIAGFDREVLHWPGYVLVEFWSPRCGICIALMSMIRSLARLKAGAMKVALINIEREWLLAQNFDIRSTPVFLVYRNGTKTNELYGALPKRELEAWIASAIPV